MGIGFRVEGLRILFSNSDSKQNTALLGSCSAHFATILLMCQVQVSLEFGLPVRELGFGIHCPQGPTVRS